MKTKSLKSVVLESKQCCGVALLSFVCSLWFAVMPVAAQSPNQKRITALQPGAAAEGSRLTIVSDSALNDYEAFRRGDHFYVKIPLAESTSELPHCCGDGFKDVKVKRVGDNLVVSFRLQPGANARVDQRSNQLDVIFSAPNRSLRDNTANAVTGEARVENESRPPQYRRRQGNPHTNLNIGANNHLPSGNNESSASNVTDNLPPAVPSQSSIPTTSTSASSPASTTATPATLSSSKPVLSSSSSSESPLKWKTRGQTALQWVWANRLATLIGALVLLSLILYLAMALRRRQRMLERSA
jgi:hypothetical protein